MNDSMLWGADSPRVAKLRVVLCTKKNSDVASIRSGSFSLRLFEGPSAPGMILNPFLELLSARRNNGKK